TSSMRDDKRFNSCGKEIQDVGRRKLPDSQSSLDMEMIVDTSSENMNNVFLISAIR
ncbi:hypothetical protein J6590_106227, partial [Homalodisca vitripennis]